MILESAVMTALATGALGSAHCAAMCGPLAVAGCSGDKGFSPRRTAGYFVGRTLAYGTVGAVLGHLGHHALCLLPMGALEGVAIALVAGAAVYRGIKLLRPGKKATTPLVQLRLRRPSSLLGLVAELLPQRGLGLVTGVMPCGLLLPAWALAAGTASAPSGALVITIFSFATLPGLLVPIVGRQIFQQMISRFPSYAYGLAWCALALWIAARPLLRATGHCH